jgi:hypothetical protein
MHQKSMLPIDSVKEAINMDKTRVIVITLPGHSILA